MSEVFNFQRFWTFFKFDLKQMWRNHFKVAIFLGMLPLFLYIVWVLCSLALARTWSAPSIEARAIVLYLTSIVLVLYQARTYGHLTDRRKGSSYLMIPASVTEKFVSMMVMTLIVIPFLFASVYFLLDGLLSLIDSHYGKALMLGIGQLFGKVWQSDIWDVERMESFPKGILLFTFIISTLQSMVYFLLSGLVFKKWKILGGLLVSYGFGLILTIIAGLLVTGESFKNWAETYFNDMNPDAAMHFVKNSLVAGSVISTILLVVLMIGVYFRIKTIKH